MTYLPIHAVTTIAEQAAKIEIDSQQEGLAVVFIYISLQAPGPSWETLEAFIPGNLDHKVRRLHTPLQNGLLVFRSTLQKEGYEQWASLAGHEIMVRIPATTLWGKTLVNKPLIQALQPQDLPVLLLEEELLLELSLRRMARTANLTTTQSTSTVIKPHIDRP